MDSQAFVSRSPLDNDALRQQSYSTDSQSVRTQISRTPATQLLVINSKDRNQSSSTGAVIKQPWNQFRLQRPQSIMQTYATRLLVTEINFPYYIPNINALTNQFWILGVDIIGVLTLYQVRLNPGFYVGGGQPGANDLSLAINAILTESPGYTQLGVAIPIAGGAGKLLSPPDVDFLPNKSFSWVNSVPVTGDFALFFYNPCPQLNLDAPGFVAPAVIPPFITPPTESVYVNSASLMNLMGMDYVQVIGTIIATNVIEPVNGVIGNPTTLQYTQYIDIVSDKLHQFTTNRDGNTDNFFSRNLLCRLYISDESSNIVQGFQSQSVDGTGTAYQVNFVPGVNAPMIIHRQFKSPKAVMWNKESAVDWLDIAVYDQYGNLVPTTPFASVTATGFPLRPPFFTYPDFQITLQASEN
jgi:hypothetical protein